MQRHQLMVLHCRWMVVGQHSKATVMSSKKINLALQGGGAHGAYTWGVLDRLLEEEDLIIDSISGTSAGAMNGAIMAYGYRHGGRKAAKEKLEAFWHRVSQMAAFANPVQQTQLERFTEGWNIDDSFSYQWFDMLTRMFSPYQLNPLNLNPMRTLLAELIDWDKFNEGGDMHLFVTATCVRTGQPRVFKCHEINEDVLLASACIPFYFQSVVIEGEAYWDGGYMGNPSIWPLIYSSHVGDVLLVQINPIVRSGLPKTAHEIVNRMNEITFNSSLIAEMRAINFVSRLVRDNHLDTKKYRDVRMHLIPAPDDALGLNASSKVNTDWAFLQFLRDTGRKVAEQWLVTCKADVGVKSTVDIEEAFLNIRSDVKASKATA
jgi:NTE family protein